MPKTVAHVSELPPHLRKGRDQGFVTIDDAPTPTDEQKLERLRDMIAEGDADCDAGRESPADDVFARLRARLRERHGL